MKEPGNRWLRTALSTPQVAGSNPAAGFNCGSSQSRLSETMAARKDGKCILLPLPFNSGWKTRRILPASIEAWEVKYRINESCNGWRKDAAQQAPIRNLWGIMIQINDKGFICCPECGKQTKTKVLPETELKYFPLYCPWCKKEQIVSK